MLPPRRAPRLATRARRRGLSTGLRLIITISTAAFLGKTENIKVNLGVSKYPTDPSVASIQHLSALVGARIGPREIGPSGMAHTFGIAIETATTTEHDHGEELMAEPATSRQMAAEVFDPQPVFAGQHAFDYQGRSG
jgi:hypothetical protein